MMLVVVLLASAGAVYLGVAGRTSNVCIAAADLPAFHQIEERDVTCLPMPSRTVPQDAIHTAELSLGRYTLEATKKGAEIMATGIGPRLSADRLDGVSIVALAYSPATAVGGSIAPGDMAVLLIPEDKGTRALHIEDVLVLASRESSESVVVALGSAQTQAFLDHGQANGVVLLRSSPYDSSASTGP
jgi:Flp pilus assembly protein CpaB